MLVRKEQPREVMGDERDCAISDTYLIDLISLYYDEAYGVEPRYRPTVIPHLELMGRLFGFAVADLTEKFSTVKGR